MKGIELPINILVIIAVAVIVLLGVIALYFSGFMGPAATMGQQAAKTKYCALIMRTPNGCTVGTYNTYTISVTDFDADRDGTVTGAAYGGAAGTFWTAATCGASATAKDNLGALLKCYYGVGSEADALKACGCA